MDPERAAEHRQRMQRRQAVSTRTPTRPTTPARLGADRPNRPRPSGSRAAAASKDPAPASTPRLRSIPLASAPVASSVAPAVVFVTPSAVASNALASPAAKGWQPGSGTIAAIISGGVVAVGILGMIVFFAIRRCRRRKSEKQWWNLSPGKVVPDGGAGGLSASTPPSYSSEKLGLTDADMSGDTLVDEKPIVARADSRFKRSKSNASTTSRANGTVSPFDVADVPPVPGSSPYGAPAGPPSRPPRPSMSFETGDRRKDTVMGFTDVYGSFGDDAAPEMPANAQDQIGQAMSAPRPSLEHGSRPFVVGGGPAAVVARPSLSPVQSRESRPPRDLEVILDSFASANDAPRSSPSLGAPAPGFAASSSGSIRRPPPPSLSVGGSAIVGPSAARPGYGQPDGLSPIPEMSARSASTATPASSSDAVASVGSRAAQHDGYRLRLQHMSIHSSVGETGDYGDGASPRAQTFGERTPMLREPSSAVELLSPMPLTPYEHVPVLGLASIPPSRSSSSHAVVAAAPAERASTAVTDSLGGAFDRIMASMLVDEDSTAAQTGPVARQRMDSASDASTPGPLTPAAPSASTFGRSAHPPAGLLAPESEFQPLSQMRLAAQQPDYRSPTLSVYDIFNDGPGKPMRPPSGASPSLV